MDIMSYLMGQNSAIKKGMKVEVVTELPDTGVANVIYLVPKEDTGDNDIFDEYLWVDDDWEHIGSTDIDLSNYYTKSEVVSLIQDSSIISVTSSLSLSTLNAVHIFSNAPIPKKTLSVVNTSTMFSHVLIYMTDVDGNIAIIDASGALYKSSTYHRSGIIFYKDGGITFSRFAVTTTFNGTLKISLDSDTQTSNNANKAYVDNITGALASLNTTDKTSLVNAINEVLAGSGGNSEAVKVLYLDDYSSSSNALDMSKFETGLYIILRKREGNTMYMKPRASASARGLQNATGFNNLTLLLYSSQLPEIYDSNARGFTIFQLNPNSFGYWVYTDYNTHFEAAWNTVVESVSVANNQTITGTKNFSTLPVSSVTPTFNNQLVNKQYVDDSIASAITDALGGSY